MGAIHDEMSKEAYEMVRKAGINNAEFRSVARAFPSMLQVNGLGNAIAFLYAKKNDQSKKDKKNEKDVKNVHDILYKEIECWTWRTLEHQQEEQAQKSEYPKLPLDLMERITKLDSTGYRIYTDEIMHLCLWIKRFAEGMIKAEK